MKNKLGRKTWLAIVLFSLCGQVAWTMENMFFNVFIQDEFSGSLNNIALMVALSALSATLTTLFMGALSDKIGKRKIFICFGYLLWGLSIMAFALLRKDVLSNIFGASISAVALGVGLTITFDCIMTFFGSTANDAAFNAWLTETVEDNNRGKVEGINAAMPLIAILLVFGGKMVADMFVEDISTKWTVIFLIIGALVISVGILGFFIIKEPVVEKKEENYFKNIFYGFSPKIMKENKTLYILLLGMMIFSISIQVFMPYLIIYYERTIELKNYVLIFAPAIIIAALFTVICGKYIDKIRFIYLAIFTLIIYLVGLTLLSIFTNVVLVFIGTLFMMIGYLSLGAIFNAKMRDYTPKDKVGSFQGIRIFASVLVPMLIGPWIGAAVSGGGGMFGVVGNDYIPSSLIFVFAIIVGIVTILAIFIAQQFIDKGSVSDAQLSNDDSSSETIQ